jgi:hypothetical protein
MSNIMTPMQLELCNVHSLYLRQLVTHGLTLLKLQVIEVQGPPLWSSGQSSWLQIQRSRVRFPALPDFLRNRGSRTGSTQPREDN